MRDRNRRTPRVEAKGGRHRKVGKVEGNPAMIRAGVVSALTLLAALGFRWAADVDRETVAAIVTLLAVGGPLVAGLWTRFAVTPNVKVVSRVTTEGDVVAGDAALAPTGDVLVVHESMGGPVVEPVKIRSDRVA